MKKTATLLTGFLLIIISLHAQKKQPKFLTELSFGPSFPIGRFAATSYNDKNEVPGFAKTGLGAHLSVGYYLNKSVGLLLSTGYTVHPQDAKAYSDFVETSFPALTVRRLEVKSWKSAKLMAGGFVVTPLTAEGELSLLTKLTAGVSKTRYPKREFYGSNQDGTWTASSIGNEMSLPWSFCYQVSIALEYSFSRNWYATLDISSFNTTAKKDLTYTIYPGPAPSPGGPGTVMTIKNKYKQATVNALVGIGVRF
jgi:hypothetical protein